MGAVVVNTNIGTVFRLFRVRTLKYKLRYFFFQLAIRLFNRQDNSKLIRVYLKKKTIFQALLHSDTLKKCCA